jgi:uncharacterized protein YjhX (UPF0386 family)
MFRLRSKRSTLDRLGGLPYRLSPAGMAAVR